MRGLALFYVLGLVACASGRPANQEVDSGPPVTDAPADAMLNNFGEPCTDNHQCESGLCILVGTSGQCTKTCGDCPTGYGCLGVEGISVEGQVTFVCVPTSSQLCTTCAQDSECTLIGMDKCVTYPDGDHACARDCSTITCPTGFTCENLVINNTNYKQCMASSGACDCTAANPGAMQPCNIMTPWNVCVGSQTCAGGSGWGTCQPPSPNDDPDPTFADTNCDGIDGDRARAIFVSPAGVNTSTCGLVYTDPCQTIQFGISRAVATSRPHVYLQAGTYNGTITMANGVSLFGGYDFNWRRRPYSESGHTVTILGGVIGIRCNAITQPTWLDDVVIRSADATTAGGSSIGVLVASSTLVEVRGVLVQAGAGAPARSARTAASVRLADLAVKAHPAAKTPASSARHAIGPAAAVRAARRAAARAASVASPVTIPAAAHPAATAPSRSSARAAPVAAPPVHRAAALVHAAANPVSTAAPAPTGATARRAPTSARSAARAISPRMGPPGSAPVPATAAAVAAVVAAATIAATPTAPRAVVAAVVPAAARAAPADSAVVVRSASWRSTPISSSTHRSSRPAAVVQVVAAARVAPVARAAHPAPADSTAAAANKTTAAMARPAAGAAMADVAAMVAGVAVVQPSPTSALARVRARSPCLARR